MNQYDEKHNELKKWAIGELRKELPDLSPDGINSSIFRWKSVRIEFAGDRARHHNFLLSHVVNVRIQCYPLRPAYNRVFAKIDEPNAKAIEKIVQKVIQLQSQVDRHRAEEDRKQAIVDENIRRQKEEFPHIPSSFRLTRQLDGDYHVSLSLHCSLEQTRAIIKTVQDLVENKRHDLNTNAHRNS